MKRVYNTGVDENQISMEVKVNTVGSAYTAVYLVRSGGQFSKINESFVPGDEQEQLPNGNIDKFQIGKASKLRSSYIVVRTQLGFAHIPDLETRKRAVELTRIDYNFFGGASEDQSYNYDNDDITVSPDYRMVSIAKPVEMI